MSRLGTAEPLIQPEGDELALLKITRQWRKPLRIDEINQLAPTAERRERRGRP
jgi:hypothetical protein